MKRLWSAWVRLTSRRERATSLAVLRIAVALVMLTTLLSAMRAGVVDALWIDRAYGGVRDVGSMLFPLRWLGGAKPEVVWSVSTVACVACLAMAVGLGGRFGVLAAALSYRTVSTINGASGGYDNMIASATWLLFLSSSTTTLSIDCLRRHGRWTSDEEVPAWPRFLVLGQLVLVYTASGLQKTSASWTFADEYSALYWFLQDPTWIRFDMGWTVAAYPLTQLMTFAVWHFEVGAPLLLLVLYLRDTQERGGRLRRWSNRYDLRKPWAAFGIGMHLGIGALMNMGPFSWISIAYYACLFRPDEIEGFASRCFGWLRRGRGPRRSSPGAPSGRPSAPGPPVASDRSGRSTESAAPL